MSKKFTSIISIALIITTIHMPLNLSGTKTTAQLITEAWYSAPEDICLLLADFLPNEAWEAFLNVEEKTHDDIYDGFAWSFEEAKWQALPMLNKFKDLSGKDSL